MFLKNKKKTLFFIKKHIKKYIKIYFFIAGGAKPPQTPHFLFGSVGRPIGRSVGSAGDAKKNLKKSIFQKIQYFFIFRLSNYISACFDSKIECALKKHVWGLIFVIFGWIKGRFTPKQYLQSS